MAPASPCCRRIGEEHRNQEEQRDAPNIAVRQNKMTDWNADNIERRGDLYPKKRAGQQAVMPVNIVRRMGHARNLSFAGSHIG